MTVQEDCYGILTELGLTKLQINIYLVLNKLGNAPIKAIAENARIDRAHTYQVIAKLQEMGLVQKIVSKPNLFNPLPLQEGMQILFERKIAEFKEFEENTRKKIEGIKQQELDRLVQNEESRIVLTEGKEANMRIFAKLFKNIKTTYDGIFICPENFCRYILRILDGTEITTRKLLDNDVKFRLIICNIEEKKVPTKIIEAIKKLNQKGTFDIRYTRDGTASQFGIIDGKETYMLTGTASNVHEKPSLTSNNPVIVAMAQGYFEKMWQKAQEKQVTKQKSGDNN
ncbi:MAG: helix-turn-helix domain-containing protein [Candidatus Bathyarchaeota archaeon]|nr:helix-turn-helix domain-containing protein [Candidatus Bathyarchaeota archaeon]